MHRNEDFFQAIGHISVLFATLDLFVSIVFLRLIGAGNADSQIPFHDRTTLGQKLRMLEDRSSNDVVNPQLLNTLQAQLPAAIAVANERNRYIHDMWIFDSDLVSQGRIRRARLEIDGLRTGSLSEPEELTLEELYEFAKKVGDIQKIFGDALQVLDPNAHFQN